MGAVKQFYDVTVRLIELLEKNDQIERDEKLQQIEELLDTREKSLQMIRPPFSREEEELAKKAFTLNEHLVELMEKDKVLIEKDINRLKKRRKTSKIYINPYASLQGIEGAYYDKKN